MRRDVSLLSSYRFSSTNLILPQLISSCLSSSHLTSSHSILPNLISAHSFLPHLISSYLISFHLTSSHFILLHLISSYLISSHLTSSHLILSHLISFFSPVPNLWYGWLGSAVLLLSWSSRHVSEEVFFSCSELTALSSRPVADSVNRGDMKNWAKLWKTDQFRYYYISLWYKLIKQR